MRSTSLLILAVFLCAGSSGAQEYGPIVADIIMIEVAVSYGDHEGRLESLPTDARELDRRDEPGLLVRLSKRPLRAGSRLVFSVGGSTYALSWNKRKQAGRELIDLRWFEQNSHVYIYSSDGRREDSFYSRSAGDHQSPSALWRSHDSFQVFRENNWHPPYVMAGGARIDYLMVVPRLEEHAVRDEKSPPFIGDALSIDEVIQIAGDHHALTGIGSSREFLADLARFVAIKGDFPRESLSDFLDLDQARARLEVMAQDMGRRRSRRRNRVTMVNENEVHHHQAMLRAGHMESPPWSGGEVWLDAETYATYRQMIATELLSGPTKIALIEGLLDTTTSTSAHEQWIRLIEDGDIEVDVVGRQRLLKRLHDELSARNPLSLSLIALANIAGLVALILAIRVTCRRLLFR